MDIAQIEETSERHTRCKMLAVAELIDDEEGWERLLRTHRQKCRTVRTHLVGVYTCTARSIYIYLESHRDPDVQSGLH